MRIVGALLIAMIMLPWYVLLGVRAGGPAAEQALRLGPLYTQSVWTGAVLAIVAAVTLSVLLGARRFRRMAPRGSGVLLTLSMGQLGLLCAAVAATLSAWVSVAVLNGQPALLDGVAQLLQARYFAAGQFTGPRLQDSAFWQFQFMMEAEAGWTSQYPPGYAAVLALGWKLGVAQAVGPILLASAVFLTALVAERLFPRDPLVARIAVLLTAASPFLAFHAAAYMSHTLALVLVLLAVLGALRAVDGRWTWSILAGAALGALLLTRPYVAVSYGFAVLLLLSKAVPATGGSSFPDVAKRLVGAALAGAPFLIVLMGYNTLIFGGPMTFGYVAAEGPGHALGFHIDPWGSPYGLIEAIGYTSADLAGLSLDLLQTPIPALLVIGIYLLMAPPVDTRLLTVAGLAIAPVVAHFFYWHHDLYMGPRLLYEAAPWWCMLLAASAVGMARRAPARLRGPLGSVLAPRAGLAGALLIALLTSVAYAAPGKLRSYADAVLASASGGAPQGSAPSLVFVHTSWEDRLASRLVARGMRLDSVRAALRQNSSCSIQRYLQMGNAGRDTIMLAADVGAGPAYTLRRIEMPSGSVITISDGESLTTECEREAASDFSGVLSLPPFLWQGDLPGLATEGVMYVRDLGPDKNGRILEQHRPRRPHVLVRTREGALQILPYSTGMRMLWSPAESDPMGSGNGLKRSPFARFAG